MVLDKCKTDDEARAAVEQWLRSYKINEFFDGKTLKKEKLSLIPENGYAMGVNEHAIGGDVLQQFQTPKLDSLANVSIGEKKISSMKIAGEFLRESIVMNPKNFRIFSPDETYSNKIDAVFEVTDRVYLSKPKPWEIDL